MFLIRLHWLEWFIKKHYVHVLQEAGIAVGVLVAIQLLYPVTFARPRTFIGNNNYGFKSYDSTVSKLNQLNSKQVKVALAGRDITTKLSDTGLQVNSENIANQAIDYKWYERLIPFSILASKNFTEIKLSKINPDQTNKFVTSIKNFDTSAADAEVKLVEGEVQVKPAVIGAKYKEEAVNNALENITLTNEVTIKVPVENSDPEITTSEAEKIAAIIKQRISTPLVINIDGDKLDVTSKQMAAWISPVKNDKGDLVITYNRDQIKETLKSLQSKIYISQVANTVTLVDGDAVGSTAGKRGQILNLEQTVDAIIADTSAGRTQSTGVVSPVNASTQYIRSYTKSSKGMQALIIEWVKSHGGQYGVSMASLDGSISASVNGGTRFTSASIYKLYFADIVYNKVASGQLSLSDPINGSTIGGCIEVMIVRSDNSCAIALGNLVGWSANDGYLHNQGFGSTTFASSGHLTTANDTAKLLSKLMAGSLISSDHKNLLLGYMGRNIYRSGIPAGSLGSVANKVGFLDGLNHDAGVVYHPKGSYVLVVMSNGSSFSNIADLSRKISNLMNQ